MIARKSPENLVTSSTSVQQIQPVSSFHLSVGLKNSNLNKNQRRTPDPRLEILIFFQYIYVNPNFFSIFLYWQIMWNSIKNKNDENKAFW